MTVKFLLESDILESTIVKNDTTFRMSDELANDFILDINQWYEEEALELGVDVENIMVYKPYNPFFDIVDNRDRKLVKLCVFAVLRDMFFSLSKGDGKSNEDIYWKKYIQMNKNFEDYLSYMSYYRIIGEKPAIYKSSDSWNTVETLRGS